MAIVKRLALAAFLLGLLGTSCATATDVSDLEARIAVLERQLRSSGGWVDEVARHEERLDNISR